MENVKGLANKEGGKIKNEVISQIRSIIEEGSFKKVQLLFKNLKKNRDEILNNDDSSINIVTRDSQIIDENKYIDALLNKFEYEISTDSINKERLQKLLIDNFDNSFKIILREGYIPYQFSKSNKVVNTVRHGINLLRSQNELDNLSSLIIKIKSRNNIDNDIFTNHFDNFLRNIDKEEILSILKIHSHKLQNLIFKEGWMKSGSRRVTDRIDEMKEYISIYELTFSGCVEKLSQLVSAHNKNYGIFGKL
jgi:hypothetical protein